MALASPNHSLVYLNGNIYEPKDAKVSVFDRGFLFGDGVYETGRSYERCPLFLEEHWARLIHSGQRLGIPLPWSEEELTRSLLKTATQFGEPNIYFRTIVTRGVIERVSLDLTQELSPTLVHIVQSLPPNLEERSRLGTRLATSRVVRNSSEAQDPNIKTSNYLNSLLALQDARSQGAEDAVMCDAKGVVTEGTTFSVFGVTQDHTLITPALGVGILDSITRRHILQIAQKEMKVEEGSFSVADFLSCEECFIASSVREIRWVRQWDSRQFGAIGEVTKALHEKLKTVIQNYVATHPKF